LHRLSHSGRFGQALLPGGGESRAQKRIASGAAEAVPFPSLGKAWLGWGVGLGNREV
jgi:hypothetical protein